MAFVVSQEPQVMAVNKHGVNYFPVPFGRIKFCFGEDSVHSPVGSRTRVSPVVLAGLRGPRRIEVF
jgi:hypothetical protein